MTDPVTLTGQDGTPYLAVDVIPDEAADAFVVDVSEVDGWDLLDWGPDVGWVNVVCDVTRAVITRGSTRLQGVLTRAEAAHAEVELLDSQRRFDPMVNADAVHANTPLRIRAWGTDEDGDLWEAVLFTGTLEDVPVVYPRTGPPVVTLTATDLIGTLSAAQGPGYAEPGIGAGDTLRGRAERTLQQLGLPLTRLSGDSDVAYAATLAPAPLSDPWGELCAAQDAELGRLWVNKADQLVVRSRGSELTGPVRGTLSDLHGEEVNGAPHCCVEDLDATLGTETLINRAMATRRIPNTGVTPLPVSGFAIAEDTYSMGRYGVRTPGRSGPLVLELQTDAQLAPWAQAVVLAAGRPDLRVDRVVPSPSPLDLDSALRAWPAVCATDLGDRWMLRHRPETGPDLERTVGILGISWTLTPDLWSVTWSTTEAPTPGDDNPSGWFLVDVSELGSDDILAPYGGVPAA